MSQKQKRQTQPYLKICLDHLEHVSDWQHIGCRIVTDRDECVKYLVHECLEKYKDISELAYSHHFHDDGRRNKMLSVIMSDSLNLIKQIENQDVVNDETLQRVRDLVRHNAKYHFNSYLQSSL